MIIDELFHNKSLKLNADFLIYQDHHEKLVKIIFKIFSCLLLNVH